MKSALEMAEMAMMADEASLYAVLGLALEPHMGASSDNQDRLAEKGELWFNEQRSKISETICAEPFRRDFKKTLQSDEMNACLMLADVLATVVHGVPIYVISALTLKLTLHNMCDDH
jgi:hypothetical protein